MREPKRVDGQSDRHSRRQHEMTTELDSALEREAQYASRHMIRLSLMVAAMLREQDGAKKIAVLFKRLNERAYVPLHAVLRVAQLFNATPERSQQAFQRGFLAWEWEARLRRAKHDEAKLAEALQELEHTHSDLTVVRPVKPALKPDVAKSRAAVKRIEGKTIASAECDGFNVVLRADDATQVIISTPRRAPVTVEAVEPSHDA